MSAHPVGTGRLDIVACEYVTNEAECDPRNPATFEHCGREFRRPPGNSRRYCDGHVLHANGQYARTAKRRKGTRQ